VNSIASTLIGWSPGWTRPFQRFFSPLEIVASM
jgi:hypothetical protein